MRWPGLFFMRTYHIYTDASVKIEKNYVSQAFIVVTDSHIVCIKFKERQLKQILFGSNYYERITIIWAIKYVEKHYNPTNLICYCDNLNAVQKGYKDYKIKWIKGHSNIKRFKHRFNNLADWICKHGPDNWKEYYYSTL